jgi:hypothetical protein
MLKATGIISNHIGTAPVVGFGSLGGLMPVSFDSKTRSLLHPVGMPIATTLNPINPYDLNSTIVTNPFGGLSGMTGLTSMNFDLGNVQKTYNKDGINVVITGCTSDVDDVIKCLTEHLAMSKASK